jgi:SnoaL-like protein
VPDLTTDDRLAIAEIMAAYCFAIDQGRWDTLPALFTEDCRLDFGEVMGVFEGHAGLERFAGMLRATGLLMRHYSTNLLLHAVGGGARAESYVLALTGPSTSRRQSTGRYEDELVKVDGRWRIRVRRAIIEV